MSAEDARRGREHVPGSPETQALAQSLPCQVTSSLGNTWPTHLNSPQRHSICTPASGYTSPIRCLPASFSLQAFPAITWGEVQLPGGTWRENKRKKLPKRLVQTRTQSSISVKETQPSPASALAPTLDPDNNRTTLNTVSTYLDLGIGTGIRDGIIKETRHGCLIP